MQKTITEIIQKHNIVIFTKSHCPYCQRAKVLFDGENKQYHEVELSSSPQMNEYMDALNEMTGARTVPRIFVGGVFKGGFDDVSRLHKQGKLFE